MYEPYFGYCQIDFWMSHVVSPASLATHYQTSPILIEISSESKFKKKKQKKTPLVFCWCSQFSSSLLACSCIRSANPGLNSCRHDYVSTLRVEQPVLGPLAQPPSYTAPAKHWSLVSARHLLGQRCCGKNAVAKGTI